MSWVATRTQGRPWRRGWSVTFAVFVTMLFAASRCGAQALRKGISVQMAVTRNAIATPDADKEDTSVVAVTHDGRVYFGIDPIAPAALAEKRGLVSRTGEKLYIKADARTAYGNVLKVLDAARRAGVAAPILLTAQQESPKPGTLVPPKGLEVLVGPPLPSGAESVQLLNSGQPGPRLKINQQDIPWAALQSKLRQLFQNRSEKVVVVKADGVLPFSDVVHVVDLCRATSAQVFLVVPGT